MQNHYIFQAVKSRLVVLFFFCVFCTSATAQTVIFCDDFESGSFGPNWVALPGSPNGVVAINTSIGNPARGVRMGKTAGAGGFITNKLDLKLDLSNYTQSDIILTFDIEDRADETHAEDGIYFSEDGGANFEKVFDFNPSLWCDYAYGSFPPFDIDSIAELHELNLTSNFVIRFQQHGDNTLPNNDGFYLDNVCVSVQTITYVNVCTTPFVDGFEQSTILGNMWTKSFPDATSILVTDPNRPTNIISIGSSIGVGGGRAVRMGKGCTDGFSTNALDLHLDLSCAEDYVLTFDIQDRADETQADDGIYFSNNGGVSFEKVFDFNPSLWCDYDYGSFPPLDIDSLAASKGLSLSSRFVVRFQQHGDNTLPNNDGFYIDNVSVFKPNIVYYDNFPTPFTDNFETGSFGPNWTRSFPGQTNTLVDDPNRPGNVVQILNFIGVSSSKGVRMGKTCADGFSTNALDLHLDLSGAEDYLLTFDIQDREDETQEDDGIYFSNDGGVSFVKVFDFNPSLWCDYAYGSLPPLDIDSLAALKGLSLSSRFVVRFQQHGDNTLPNNDGFYLDNVSVFEPNIVYYDNLPFFDNFETGSFGTSWTRSFPWQTNTLVTDPNRPNDVTQILNGIGVGGGRAVRMGKTCADGFSTNALDLHLDLSGADDYALTFDIEDREDETQEDDGIYFSNDGGVSFEKVFDFNPSLWCDYAYGSLPPLDIDSLAALKGLSLSSRFVVRFQQHGDNTLPNNDGFYIDNVRVFEQNIVYHDDFPFIDNFETANLGASWTRSFPWQTSTLVDDPNRPTSVVELANSIGVGNSRAVRLGKSCADGFSTNALDLHLDLSGLEQSMMTFKLQHRSEEAQVDDGVYFSDDAGVSFSKVLDFDFSIPPYTYTQYTINIDSLAASVGLNLSSRFVVRFQQHGDNVLPNNDGLYLDDVNITGVVISTTTFVPVKQFNIYPNPATDFIVLNISGNNMVGVQAYKISNAVGQLVAFGEINGIEDQVDVSLLTSGLYIIEVYGKKGRYVQRFFKQ